MNQSFWSAATLYMALGYACGTPLDSEKTIATPPSIKRITSFEEKNPFGSGTIVQEHATEGLKALRIDKSFASMEGPQDWTGYDYLKADLFTASQEPLQLYVEIRDTATRDYWTRVNYSTVVPPGQSTLVLPVKQLYVGEKSRQGRMLMLNAINLFVLGIGDHPAAPLFVDNLRLERDDSAQQVQFDGLYALDFGTGTSPVLEGFTPITPATTYSKERGYGLKGAKIWRAFDVLQPDPLYLYKASKQFNLKFRLSWHWNAAAGDPYYALDCREDDYAWCSATPDALLIPSIHFEQLRAGLDDYRCLLTLARLAKEKAGTPAAKAGEDLITSRLSAFRLGQREHDLLFPPEDWRCFRHQLADAIENLVRQE